MSYLVPLKTLLVDALRQTFDAEFPERDFRNLHVSIEFPNEQQAYPGIWVDYSPVGPLQIIGVSHREYSGPGDDGTGRRYTRWRFQGEASFTLVALTSLERDRLHDAMVGLLAFGTQNDQTSEFRAYIEDNEFLAVNFDFDEINTRGFANSMGTPWMTDEMIYEAEISMECFGEFVSDGQSLTLVPLSDIEITAIREGDEDPTDDEGWQ